MNIRRCAEKYSAQQITATVRPFHLTVMLQLGMEWNKNSVWGWSPGLNLFGFGGGAAQERTIQARYSSPRFKNAYRCQRIQNGLRLDSSRLLPVRHQRPGSSGGYSC